MPRGSGGSTGRKSTRTGAKRKPRARKPKNTS